MFGDGDLTLRTLKLWSTLEISGVLLEFADDVEVKPTAYLCIAVALYHTERISKSAYSVGKPARELPTKDAVDLEPNDCRTNHREPALVRLVHAILLISIQPKSTHEAHQYLLLERQLRHPPENR